MKGQQLLIDFIKDEEDDFYSDDSLFNISSWGADLSFRELISQYEDGDLLKPELQRNYVWDKTEASRFIDSILLGLPVPSIFLAKTKDEKMLIVDGYQRIMTVYDYVRGIFSGDEKIFRLTNSKKINKRWRGKAFSELSETEQRKIRTTTIHCIIFVQLEPEDNDTSLYQVFERINTSGRTLMPQEIRNCVYQGKFNSLLIELNMFEPWRILFGSDKPDPRMRDMEFILRFFALASDRFGAVDSETISLKKFLNVFMGSFESNMPEELERRRRLFMDVISFISGRLGRNAFHNFSKKSGRFSERFNPTVFDSIAIATARAVTSNVDLGYNLEDRRYELLLNEEYQDLIRYRTTQVSRIKQRIDLASTYLFR